MAHARKVRSRRHWYIPDEVLAIAIRLIRHDWSPEQAADWLRLNRVCSISHQTLYRYGWYDRT